MDESNWRSEIKIVYGIDAVTLVVWRVVKNCKPGRQIIKYMQRGKKQVTQMFNLGFCIFYWVWEIIKCQ